MIEHFDSITNSEFELLKKSVSWITILVGAADDDFDKEEQEWANKLTKIRSYGNPDILNDFYKEVGADYQNEVNTLLADLPKDVTARNAILSDRLSQLNPILAKLNSNISYRIYKSLTSFANHVAKSSGGFLGFFSVSEKESKWVNLDMIDPILAPEEDA